MNRDYYEGLNARRQAWEPIKPKALGQIHEGALASLKRCVALRVLELDVRDWLYNEKDCRIPAWLKDILNLNMADEDRHDQALNNIAEVLEIPDKDQHVAHALQEEWRLLAARYSFITTTAVLERSVFFVLLPFERFFGDSAIRTVSSDISNDERIHAGIHTQLAIDLGWGKGNDKINRLRKDTVDWMFSDLNVPDHPFGNPAKWHRQSTDLFTRAKAPELKETKRAIAHAFFEKPNSVLPKYY